MANAIPFTPCLVCLTPYRKHIEEAWAATDVVGREQWLKARFYKKYHEHFRIKTRAVFNKIIRTHFDPTHMRQAKKFINLTQPPGSPQPSVKPSTLNDLSQSLLDIGAQMADYYKKNPMEAVSNLNFRDIFAAQDTITKRMMVQVNKDAVKIQMARLFSGQMPKQFKFEEGKVVDENGAESLIQLLAGNKE